MLLLPRFFKYKKIQKGKAFNKIDNIIIFKNIKFDTIKLIATSHGRLYSKQINSISFIMNKIIKKLGKVKLNLFPHNPITKKPNEVRMGKGKGNVNSWGFNLKPGFTICEIYSTDSVLALKALKMAQIRLPIKTKKLSFKDL
jgi:large subunit ribosomal protein L16